jgi:uncharacterized membrane protein YphA (DoxX/SURF4 family)
MFSMFPDGWPGAGLLLLRAAGGAVLIIQSAAYFGIKRESGLLMVAIVSFMGTIGFLLVIGFLTRFVAALAAAVGVSRFFSLFAVSSVGPFVAPTTAMLAVVIALALVCLGPGALSLDARLFGRREIVVPTGPSKA